MEARNFVTAREMVIDGHWLIPTMNGELRITKPPLPTWMTAAAGIAAGNVEDPVVMRLPASMMASLMVFGLWGLMRTVSKDQWLPIISAIIFATSLLVIDMGRRGSWDIYCHSFMMLGIWALSYGLNKKETVYGGFALAGALLSLSAMSKGPVAFYTLLLPFSAGYMAVFGLDNIRSKWKALLLSFVIFLILSALWPGFIYFQYPHMFTLIAIQETAAWANRHVKPFYFYAHFAVYTGLWMIFVIAGLIKPYAGKKIASIGKYRFALTWLVLSLLLLSILPEKKERYLLPAIVPMSILTGYLWQYLIHANAANRLTRWDTRWVILHAFLGFVASIAMPVILFKFGVSTGLISLGAGIGWGVVFVLTAMIFCGSGMKKAVLTLFVSTLTLVCLINVSVLPVFYQSPLYKKNPDSHPLRAIGQTEALNGLKFYSTGNMNIKLIWDVGRLVRPWNFQNEPLPMKNLPIALISGFDPTPKIPVKYLSDIEIALIEKYPCQSKKPYAAFYILLISPKHQS